MIQFITTILWFQSNKLTSMREDPSSAHIFHKQCRTSVLFPKPFATLDERNSPSSEATGQAAARSDEETKKVLQEEK
jgi:hypothetical protein